MTAKRFEAENKKVWKQALETFRRKLRYNENYKVIEHPKDFEARIIDADECDSKFSATSLADIHNCYKAIQIMHETHNDEFIRSFCLFVTSDGGFEFTMFAYLKK